MKIGYCPINSPFKYHLSYLNDGIKYKVPDFKQIPLLGTLLVQYTTRTKRGPCDINSISPLTMVEKAALIIPLKLPLCLTTLSLTTKLSAFQKYSWFIPIRTKFCKMLTYNPIGLVCWNRPKISKMMMIHTSPMLSTGFATPFFIMLPLPDILLQLATAFSITCIVARKNSQHDPQSFYIHFQKAFCAVTLLECLY